LRIRGDPKPGGNNPGQSQVLSIAIRDSTEAMTTCAQRLSLLMFVSAFVVLALLMRGTGGAGSMHTVARPACTAGLKPWAAV